MAGRDPAALFHSLSDPSRLRLLRLLGRAELNVQELVAITGLSQPRVSRHLGVLRKQGWLRQRREGTWNWYRTVTAEEFPFGAPLVAEIFAAADRIASAGDDDRSLAVALEERQRRSDDFFAGLAARWDRIRSEYDHPEIGLGTIAALVDPRLRVLDIGTGTGAMLPLLGNVVNTVVALDNSRAMLERARTLCRDEGLAGVSLCNGNVEELPFADAAFDACHCAMVLHHVERPADVVAEMARVVRPAGRIMLTAFCPHEEAWMRDELAHRWLGFAREEIEEHMRRAELTPDRWLVRSRCPDGTAARAPAGRRQPRWPDVFLATASRNR